MAIAGQIIENWQRFATKIVVAKTVLKEQASAGVNRAVEAANKVEERVQPVREAALKQLAELRKCVVELAVQGTQTALKQPVAQKVLGTVDELKNQILEMDQVKFTADKAGEARVWIIRVMERVEQLGKDVAEFGAEQQSKAVTHLDGLRLTLGEILASRTKQIVDAVGEKAAEKQPAVLAVVDRLEKTAISTAVKVDDSMSVTSWAAWVFEKAKGLDENRLRGTFRNRLVPAVLTRAESLDTRFANGQVEAYVKRVSSDFAEEKKRRAKSPDFPLTQANLNRLNVSQGGGGSNSQGN